MPLPFWSACASTFTPALFVLALRYGGGSGIVLCAVCVAKALAEVGDFATLGRENCLLWTRWVVYELFVTEASVLFFAHLGLPSFRTMLEADCARIAKFQTQPEILHPGRALSAELPIVQSEVREPPGSYKYPVLALPNELISEIFLRFLPPYPDFPPLKGLLSPTLLTHICRQWRDIALSTPQLWSAISSFDNNWEGRELPIVKLWLERSHYCPLSIKLGTETAGADDKLVEAVIPHRARWRYLKIDLEGHDSCIFDGPMPLLRHLQLVVDAPFETLVNGFSFQDLPLLRTVALNDYALPVTLPWTQLTSLALFDMYPSELVPILVQTRNLVHCELHVDFRAPEYREVWRDITLESLESLVLKHHGPWPTKDFLPTLIVPALRTLQLPESLLTPNPIGSLRAFISKSGCPLEELHLTGKISVALPSYRQTFSSLRKLSVDQLHSLSGVASP
ncbi:hypothetical protein C8R47DRAFT_1195337 [Mycena vitilis]|nr:hypothetical protein C8R47DRAFT_1195337 [Mycena vitilis]